MGFKKITKRKLNKILKKHKKWLEGKPGGVQADLSWVDLSFIDLSYKDLRGVNLSCANLEAANLVNAVLTDANLSLAFLYCTNLGFANLEGADLHNVNLDNANLINANLCNVNLNSASLCYTNLGHANLSFANLSGACLQSANLSHADLYGATGNLLVFRTGKILMKPLIGYKKCKDDVIVTLEIPEGAVVFSINGNKCRTNKAKVVSVDGANEGLSFYDGSSYRVGDEVIINDFNCEYNIECETGIHFFVNREDAVNYR